jgi:hypothetical protein
MADDWPGDALVAFRWWVPAKGVRLVRAAGERFTMNGELETRRGLFLVQTAGEDRWYSPLEERGALLDDFARAQLDDEGLVKLANRWGLLGSGDPERHWMIGVRRPEGGSASDEVQRGDFVAESRSALEEWQDAFRLWGACVQPELAGYLTEMVPAPSEIAHMAEKRRLQVVDGHAVYYAPHRAYSIGGSRRPALAPRISPRKRAFAAKLVLHRILSENLVRLTRFTPDFSFKTETPIPRGRPLSLLGALWVALLEEWGGGRCARRCPRDGKWFLADPSQERAHARIYCRPACQVAMVAKRSRARSLAADGMKAPSIAEKLGQDVKTVRAWLRDSKKVRR